MSLKNWIKLKPHWLKSGLTGGIIGIVIYYLLFYLAGITPSGTWGLNIFYWIILLITLPLNLAFRGYGWFTGGDRNLYFYILYFFIIGFLIEKLVVSLVVSTKNQNEK